MRGQEEKKECQTSWRRYVGALNYHSSSIRNSHLSHWELGNVFWLLAVTVAWLGLDNFDFKTIVFGSSDSSGNLGVSWVSVDLIERNVE